jgi:hypothetical protein
MCIFIGIIHNDVTKLCTLLTMLFQIPHQLNQLHRYIVTSDLSLMHVEHVVRM